MRFFTSQGTEKIMTLKKLYFHQLLVSVIFISNSGVKQLSYYIFNVLSYFIDGVNPLVLSLTFIVFVLLNLKCNCQVWQKFEKLQNAIKSHGIWS